MCRNLSVYVKIPKLPKWLEVRLTGQRLPGVCTLLDLFCLRLPCHCLHTLGVYVCVCVCVYAFLCERKRAGEASGVFFPPVSVTPCPY